MPRLLRCACGGIFESDTLTLEAGGYTQTYEVGPEHCNLCGRTPEEDAMPYTEDYRYCKLCHGGRVTQKTYRGARDGTWGPPIEPDEVVLTCENCGEVWDEDVTESLTEAEGEENGTD